MKRINCYGVSRVRDKKGNIIKREFKPYVLCIQSMVGGGYETMAILVAEEYEDGNVHGTETENGTRKDGTETHRNE